MIHKTHHLSHAFRFLICVPLRPPQPLVADPAQPRGRAPRQSGGQPAQTLSGTRGHAEGSGILESDDHALVPCLIEIEEMAPAFALPKSTRRH